MIYWIDTGVLIQAHRGALTQSILPQFWHFLHDQLVAEIISMPRLAYEEITERGYDDELVAWCKSRKKLGLCRTETKTVQARYGQLSAHVQDKWKSSPQQVRDWFADADGWVVASAMAMDKDKHAVVVTEEHEKSSNKNKIKIPALCRKFDIDCINTATLLRDRLKPDFSKGVQK